MSPVDTVHFEDQGKGNDVPVGEAAPRQPSGDRLAPGLLGDWRSYSAADEHYMNCDWAERDSAAGPQGGKGDRGVESFVLRARGVQS